MTFKSDQFRFFIADFDGVFTDNSVYINDKGNEFVKCSRSDGYGIKILKTANELGLVNFEMAILSTEKNKVVNKRAQKLEISCFSGIYNKYSFLEEFYFPSFGFDVKKGFSELIYLGNDLNDLRVIKNAKLSFAPKDSHPIIQKSATKVLKNKIGGHGFVREVIENILGDKNLFTTIKYLEEKS